MKKKLTWTTCHSTKRMMKILIKRTCRKYRVNCKSGKKEEAEEKKKTREKCMKSRAHFTPTHKNGIIKTEDVECGKSTRKNTSLTFLSVFLSSFFSFYFWISFSSSSSLHVFKPIAICMWVISFAYISAFDNILCVFMLYTFVLAQHRLYMCLLPIKR